jgi:hypothetical protein
VAYGRAREVRSVNLFSRLARVAIASMTSIAARFDVFDSRITRWMARFGVPLLRVSLGISVRRAIELQQSQFTQRSAHS